MLKLTISYKDLFALTLIPQKNKHICISFQNTLRLRNLHIFIHIVAQIAQTYNKGGSSRSRGRG